MGLKQKTKFISNSKYLPNDRLKLTLFTNPHPNPTKSGFESDAEGLYNPIVLLRLRVLTYKHIKTKYGRRMWRTTQKKGRGRWSIVSREEKGRTRSLQFELSLVSLDVVSRAKRR